MAKLSSFEMDLPIRMYDPNSLSDQYATTCRHTSNSFHFYPLPISYVRTGRVVRRTSIWSEASAVEHSSIPGKYCNE